MKSAKRMSGVLFWVLVVLSIPVAAGALATQYRPASPPPPTPPPARPAPAYHPAPEPSRPSYNPPQSRPSYNPSPSRPSYNPPPPAPANNPAPSQPYSSPSGSRESNPRPSAPVRTYTPGVYPSGSTSSPRNSTGGTPYSQHVETPVSSATTHPSGSTIVSGEGVRTSNGVTTYPPHASTGTSYTPAGSPAAHVNT